MAERLPGDAFELGAVDAEDLDAGFDRMARDGDEDVLAVGCPDGLRGVAAGVECADAAVVAARAAARSRERMEQPYRPASALSAVECETFRRKMFAVCLPYGH